ncbi:MAG: acyl-CoA/acyl-ACP dehydrogenase [Dehalococcoidales bacterium]|nr:acyl-CoA/acyl-ACP dehydrogenase [Dehalococcoidales bacterium]
MDPRLSEEQEILRTSARDFLTEKCPKSLVREMEKDEKGYSPALWKEIADLGWMGLAFPEEYGGAGMSFLDLAILLEEMGRALLPGPFFSTVVLGGLPILDIGTDAQKKKYLPDIIGGKAIFALALTEAVGTYNASSVKTTATAENGNYIINGTKLFVHDASVADYFLCVARTDTKSKGEDGITIFIVDAKSPGIKTTVLDTIARDKQCEVVFDNVKVPAENILGKPNEGWPEVQKIIERAAIAKCCEMLGGMQMALDMTVPYVKERIQFSVPVGVFQAVQHHCVYMLLEVEGSRAATYDAAWRVSTGRPYSAQAAITKAWVSDAYQRVVALGTQAHGGVSIIEDHDMPLYFRRAKAAELAFGDARFHRKTVARNLGFKVK